MWGEPPARPTLDLVVVQMATVSGKTKKEGFDCEFVEKPPNAVQSDCPVCKQILCEPHQVSCCGYSFCKACIKRIKTDKKSCPTCRSNEKNLIIFHNKGLQRALYGFQVYCSHKQEGCEWKGELGQLDNHLNLSPQHSKQLEGCEYTGIECIYCFELIKRGIIAVHQSEDCDKRPFSCEYCHSYESTYEDVLNNHWPVCGYYPVECPNECGTFPQYQALENHVTKDCPETVIDCDFHHVGCNVKLPRKYMPAHLNENLVTHMSLQAISYNKLLASHNKLQASHNTLQSLTVSYSSLLARQSGLLTSLQEKVNKLDSENETLEHRLSRLQLSIETNQNKAITILGFEEHKRGDVVLFAPPFYSHPGGYRFCLKVYTNGHDEAKGTHVSVYTCLLKGEFDNHLKWPFRGQISVQLVNQQGGKKHHTETITFNDKTPEDTAGRVTQGDKNDLGWGYQQFISHDKLEPKYLKNDCIYLRVAKIKVDN